MSIELTLFYLNMRKIGYTKGVYMYYRSGNIRNAPIMKLSYINLLCSGFGCVELEIFKSKLMFRNADVSQRMYICVLLCIYVWLLFIYMQEGISFDWSLLYKLMFIFLSEGIFNCHKLWSIFELQAKENLKDMMT